MLYANLAINVLFYSIVSCQVYFEEDLPLVRLTSDAIISGVVKESRDGRSYAAFTGLPYATISERFAESQLVGEPKWSGASEFKTPGPMCPQVFFDEDHDLYDAEQGCLNLNVYVPLNTTEDTFPVLVWIHGGSWTFGGGFGYGPSFFMDEKLVVVTLNYRLGVFGFLSTQDDVIPGNNGLKDQVVALKWVQKYISKFGGNQEKVTIMGESAVSYLMISESSKGLFHGAISQSGSSFCPWAYQINPKDNAKELASYLNCTDPTSSENILSCLKQVSTDELNLAQFSYKSIWPSGLPPMAFAPTAEPEVGPNSNHTPFITKFPLSLIRDVAFSPAEVPWMVGITEDEGASMANAVVLTDNDLLKALNSNWTNQALSIIMADKHFTDPQQRKDVTDKIRKFYFGDRPVSEETANEYMNFYSDGVVTSGVYMAVKDAISRKGSKPIFLYQYAYHGPFSVAEVNGYREEEAKKVGHGSELQHQFDLDNSVSPGYKSNRKEPSADDVEFSRNLVRLWASFAKNGEPTHVWGETNKWEPVSKSGTFDGLKWYKISKNPEMLPHDPYKERMEFWEREVWSKVSALSSASGRKERTEL